MSDPSFSKENFPNLCDALASKDRALAGILRDHGYPPYWQRPQGFATLIHIILEQQVSLASARAAYDKLKMKVGTITPQKLLMLTDTELKDCYFSRQKTIYARHLASAIANKELDMGQLPQLSNEDIRAKLIAIKGIGQWTVDVYLMMVLHRSDLFPLGDVALVNSLREVKSLHKTTTRDRLSIIASQWKPYRTVAAFLLWHAYISKRNLQLRPYE